MTWQDEINVPVNTRGEYAAKKFYGDPKLAAAYLPVAYALLGGVKNQMTLSGIGYGHRMVELKDGTRIRVIRNGNQNLVEIDVSIPTQRMMGEDANRGFVFFPRLDDVRVYPAQKPHGVMQVVCVGGSAKITINAPEQKNYGNQFAFFNADVYSWDHSSGGDLVGPFSGGSTIYLNGATWRTLANGIGVCGFSPVRVPADNGATVTRFVIATTQGSTVILRLYQDVSGELMELGASGPLFENKQELGIWPFRFNSTATEGSTIHCYKKEGDDENTPPDLQFAVVTASISYTIDSISVSSSAKDNGVLQKTVKYAVISTTAETYQPLGPYPAPPPGICYSFSWNLPFGISSSESSEITGYAGDSRYPIGLNYVGDTIKIAYYSESIEKEEVSSRSGTKSGNHLVDLQQSLQGSICIYTREEQYNTDQTISTNNSSSTKRIVKLELPGTVLEYDFSSHHSDVSQHISAHRSKDYGEYQKPYVYTNSVSISNQHTMSSAQVNAGISVKYLDIKNAVTVATMGYEKTQIDYSYNYVLQTNYISNSAGKILTDTRSESENESGTRVVEKKLSYLVYLNEGQLAIEDSVAPTESAPYSGGAGGWDLFPPSHIPHMFESYWPPTVEAYAEQNETTTQEIDELLSASVGGTVLFSYVKDPRLKCQRDVWAYSIKCKDDIRSDPFIDSRCTFGPLSNYLPKLDDEGKPTQEKLPGDKLTVYPIGLY